MLLYGLGERLLVETKKLRIATIFLPRCFFYLCVSLRSRLHFITSGKLRGEILVRIPLYLLLLPSIIFAQEKDSPFSASAKINVSATVVGTIELITLQDIDIGVVTPSMEFIIVKPDADQGAGLIKFTGQPNLRIRIIFSQTVIMVAGDGSTLAVQYLVNGNKINEQGTSIPLLESPAEVVMNNDGEYFIWIGCQIDITEVVPGQQYDGDFVIEVEYN